MRGRPLYGACSLANGVVKEIVKACVISGPYPYPKKKKRNGEQKIIGE